MTNSTYTAKDLERSLNIVDSVCLLPNDSPQPLELAKLVAQLVADERERIAKEIEPHSGAGAMLIRSLGDK